MRPVATDAAWSLCVSVCMCVCLSVGHNLEPYKTDEPIEVPVEIWTWLCPSKEPCTMWGPGALSGRGNFGGASVMRPFVKILRLVIVVLAMLEC